MRGDSRQTVFGIDIDGVIRDLVPSMLSVYNENFNENLGICDVKVYDVDTQFPRILKETGMSASSWFFERNGHAVFFESDPIGNPSDIVNRLRKYGKVVIISYQKSFSNKVDTLEWLNKNGIEYDGICFLKDKSIVDVDYLIDDNPDYLVGSNCMNSVLITAPYNEGFCFDGKETHRKFSRFESLEEFVKCFENENEKKN